MVRSWSRLEERFVSTEMDIETEGPEAVSGQVGSSTPTGSKRRGRRWLIWSFIFCPCHLPISMAVLAAIFGGSAFGTLIGRNTLGVGLILGAIYAVGVGIGFRHLKGRCGRKGLQRRCLRGAAAAEQLTARGSRVGSGRSSRSARGASVADPDRPRRRDDVRMTDWLDLSRRAAFESHRLIGWIFWDERAIENYAALGVPDGVGYYVTTRAAPLAAAGNQAVVAAFYSIHPDFIGLCLDLCRQHTTFEDAARARDAAVVAGLREYTPEVCNGLDALAGPLWEAADALPPSGRVLFAAHRDWPRPTDDGLLSAWLALNTIREFRGDTHWAIQIAEELTGPRPESSTTLGGATTAIGSPAAGERTTPCSPMHTATWKRAASQSTVRSPRPASPTGRSWRQRLDRMTIPAWQALGARRTSQLIELLEPVSDRYIDRVDATAGAHWMPAGRTRLWRTDATDDQTGHP